MLQQSSCYAATLGRNNGMKLGNVIVASMLIVGTLPGLADNFSVATNRIVDLSLVGVRINTNWIGHVMSDVIGTGKVISVVVLKNNTQMWSDAHAEGIRRLVQTNPTLEARPAQIDSPGTVSDDNGAQFWLDSVVILENGTIIRMERAHSWGRLTTAKGQAYFRISDARPNK